MIMIIIMTSLNSHLSDEVQVSSDESSDSKLEEAQLGCSRGQVNASHIGASTCDLSHPPFCPSSISR